MIRFDLLRALGEFIAALPPEQFDLKSEVKERGEAFEPGCGAICCAAGWAPSVPALAAAGLDRTWFGTPVLGDLPLYWDTINNFFGLSSSEGDSLFIWAYGSWLDPDEPEEPELDVGKRDKSMFLHRLAYLFKGYGQDSSSFEEKAA